MTARIPTPGRWLGDHRWRVDPPPRPLERSCVKFARSGAAVSLLAAGTLVLTACGGGTNSSSSGAGGTSGSVHCGGKKELHSSGSTAQENAMEQFVYAYVRSCPGYTLDYNANGSGAGVTQFLNNETDFAGSDVPLNPSTGQPDRSAERCGSPAWGLRRRCSARSRSPTISRA